MSQRCSARKAWSLRQFIAILLSLFLGLFLVDAALSLADSSLILLFNISALSAIREAVASVDRGVPIQDVMTLDERIADALTRPRFHATMLTLFAGSGWQVLGEDAEGQWWSVAIERSR